MPRTLSAPKNPEILGRVITALRLLAEQRPPANAKERELLARLKEQQMKPAVAKRMVATLDAMPQTRRNRFLGPIGEPAYVPPETSAEMPVGEVAITFPRVEGAHAEFGGRAEVLAADPNFTALPLYTSRYQGLFCQEETNGPGSDESYMITVAVHIDSNGITEIVRDSLMLNVFFETVIGS